MIKNKQKIIISLLLLAGISNISAQSIDLKMGDEKVKFSPSARIYLDGATFLEDKTDLSNGVNIPDVRLGFKADYQQWSVKVDMGFGKGKVAAKDVFLQYNLNKTSHLKAGHFYEPFGAERIESSSRTKFMTRNATSNAFAPGRNIGVAYTGWSNMLWYSAGLFADGGALANSKEGDDGYAATGRFVVSPLRTEGAVFHIGLGGTLRTADANGREEVDGVLRDKVRSISYKAGLNTNIESVNPIAVSISDANYQAKYGVELIGALGPVSLQSEYFHSNVRRNNDKATYQAKGAYGQLGFLLTGQKYSYSSSSAMLARPANKSLELVARFNYTDMDDKRSGIYGGTIRDWSLAANYYLNKFIMFRANYSYMSMGDYNPALASEKVHAIQGRIQVAF